MATALTRIPESRTRLLVACAPIFFVVISILPH